MRLLFTVILMTILGGAASAQDRPLSHCIAIAEALPGSQFLHKAAFDDPVAQDTVRIHYIDHASFLLLTEGGASVITDYTGFTGTSPFLPDIVTMNHAHDSHWTAFPDPDIPHALNGWGDGNTAAEHYLSVKDLLVRNVATDIRRSYGVEKHGNSIFVFEAAGLCIGHLGHLHHEPDAAQYAALGRLDVVMAAVDGGLTLDRVTLKKVLTRLKASVVIPMHWFGRGTLDRFLIDMSDGYAIQDKGEAALTVSLRDLPDRPTIIVLQPRYLNVQ